MLTLQQRAGAQGAVVLAPISPSPSCPSLLQGLAADLALMTPHSKLLCACQDGLLSWLLSCRVLRRTSPW